jgi:transporter family protein
MTNDEHGADYVTPEGRPLPLSSSLIHQSSASHWLLYTVLTMLFWGGWGLVSKPLADRLSPWQVQALSAPGLLPVIAWLARSKNLRAGAQPRKGFWLAFGSGLVASVGNVAYYQALGAGGKAAEVTPLTALYPVVTIALAIIFLGERLNFIQAAGVLASLAAMYFFNVSTDSAWLTPWIALALIPIALWGVSALLQKCAATAASSELATAAFLLGTLPISLLSPLFVPMTLMLALSTWGLGLLVGVLFGLGNLTLIFAYGSGGKASVVTPMASLYSLVTIPLAVLLLAERFTGREILGILMALVAAVALCYEKPAAAHSAALTHQP